MKNVLIYFIVLVMTVGYAYGQTNVDRIVTGSGNQGTDPNPTADFTGQNDEYMSNATNGRWDYGAANLLTTGTLGAGKITSSDSIVGLKGRYTSLDVNGAGDFLGEVDMSDSLTVALGIRTTLLDVNSTSDFLGAATFNGAVTHNSNVTIRNPVGGNTYSLRTMIPSDGSNAFWVDTIGRVSITQEAIIGDTLRVGGVADFNSTADFLGAATFNGGVSLPYNDPIIWAKGGSVVLATAGTDVTPTAGTIYWVEVVIPYNVTLTGINYLIGSVGGTDSVMVALHNSSGVQVAISERVAATALVGTAANLQAVPFSSTYAATAGRYFASVQVSGNTCRLRAYPIPGSKFVASSSAGTYGTIGNITPGSTFTADKGVILSTY